MSMSVANALKLCNEILESSLSVNIEATIEFITIFKKKSTYLTPDLLVYTGSRNHFR